MNPSGIDFQLQVLILNGPGIMDRWIRILKVEAIGYSSILFDKFSYGQKL